MKQGEQQPEEFVVEEEEGGWMACDFRVIPTQASIRAQAWRG